MNGGWRYRIAGLVGTAVFTAAAVALVNNATVLSAVSQVPVLGRLPADSPEGSELIFEILTATAAFLVAFVPLYKPRPMRILDVASLSARRVLLAMIALAAIGYFDYTYRLPRLTVILVTPMLLIALPAWFVYIRQRPTGDSERVIVIGDDPDQIGAVVRETDFPLLGYLAPMRVFDDTERRMPMSDGGLERLGGLSRIEDVLVGYEVDTAILAFENADRAEFFGALDACYEHGVNAKVHRDHVDSVLTAEGAVETFVRVEIEPWDIQDYVIKRTFDVAFAAVGLIVTLPISLLIAIAIKLEDGGTMLYRQDRTAVFGDTFDVYKFRSMVEGAEETTGPTLSEEDNGGMDPRVTRVGRVLRQTHLDEIPQLWSVLVGDMSVVGPRPERPELDDDMELGTDAWRSRWFVKPGLTGLAQISDVTGYQPEAKLRYDLEYIRKQSLWYDVKIVVRQIWKVGEDVFEAVGDATR